MVFEGRAVERLLPVLLPLLDGTRTVGEINDQLGPAVAPAVTRAVSMLAERGLLLDGLPPDGHPATVVETVEFLAASGRVSSLEQGVHVLEDTTVAVLGSGPVAGAVVDLLEQSGVKQVTALGWAAEIGHDPLDLALAVPEPAELPELPGWNRRALAAGLPWLQVLPFDGRMAAVGPLYVPDETCCYECYRRRRAANVNYPAADYWALDAVPAAYPAPPPLQQMVAGLAALLALQWLSDRAGGGRPSPVAATMHALEWNGTAQVSPHHVHRVPRCPECFPDDQGTPSPWHD